VLVDLLDGRLAMRSMIELDQEAGTKMVVDGFGCERKLLHYSPKFHVHAAVCENLTVRRQFPPLDHMHQRYKHQCSQMPCDGMEYHTSETFHLPP
jgi:hypothetical protein